MGKAKGSDFERSTCKELSLWWTNQKEDDVFWRSHSSGARATSRTKSGKTTSGQYGDICAVDHRGWALTKAFTLELKRGYSKKNARTLHDIIDGDVENFYVDWMVKTMQSAHDAQSYSWALITRRDNRKSMVWTPYKRFLRIADIDSLNTTSPHAVLNIAFKETPRSVLCIRLDDWMEALIPRRVRRYVDHKLEP